ncbi:TetR/AcrR family transcriptional regulator [Deinococcus maricopensis]|uniref:Regulatory protein TetR n=1 Tax=Deinococcus maricopensis (strain DSM 21211 / LMG 22137 / NRRL B-23946 / LB-34) TaxID=709986 RepID=E8U361_DEIML|nr:TetR/AcrR family transcriptional regulator [Deinococcus maricopensis]ADV66006.1 regulatory protein TetR [Deinococcus maricopensis DSM 21211]
MTPDSPRTLAKRQQILRAARTLFLQHGYARTSTDAITEAAGISKQTLYAYYRSKPELLAATITHELGQLALDAQPPAPATLQDLRAQLLALATRVTAHLLQADAIALLRLLIGEAVHLPELRATLRQALPARLIDLTERYLVDAHERGLIHAPDAHLSARLLVGPLMSYVALDGLFGDAPPTPPSPATLAALIDLYLRSVALPGAPP